MFSNSLRNFLDDREKKNNLFTVTSFIKMYLLRQAPSTIWPHGSCPSPIARPTIPGTVDKRSFLRAYLFPDYCLQGMSERRRGLERGKTISRACHNAKSSRRCCHLSFMNKSHQHKMHNSLLTIANNISIFSQTASKWKMIW